MPYYFQLIARTLLIIIISMAVAVGKRDVFQHNLTWGFYVINNTRRLYIHLVETH